MQLCWQKGVSFSFVYNFEGRLCIDTHINILSCRGWQRAPMCSCSRGPCLEGGSAAQAALPCASLLLLRSSRPLLWARCSPSQLSAGLRRTLFTAFRSFSGSLSLQDFVFGNFLLILNKRWGLRQNCIPLILLVYIQCRVFKISFAPTD